MFVCQNRHHRLRHLIFLCDHAGVVHRDVVYMQVGKFLVCLDEAKYIVNVLPGTVDYQRSLVRQRSVNQGIQTSGPILRYITHRNPELQRRNISMNDSSWSAVKNKDDVIGLRLRCAGQDNPTGSGTLSGCDLQRRQVIILRCKIHDVRYYRTVRSNLFEISNGTSIFPFEISNGKRRPFEISNGNKRRHAN